MSTEKAKIFEAVTDEFARAVRWTSKLTQNKDNSLISIKIANSSLIMSSYNGINSSKSKSDITQKFDGEVEFSINGTLLASAIKSMKDSIVKFSLDGRTLTVKSSKARVSLPITMPRNKLVLPPLPDVLGKVDAHVFKMMLNHATLMTSDDISAPALTTVHMEIEPQNSKLHLMATDRYKLITRTMTYETATGKDVAESFSLDIEAKSFKAMLAELSDEAELTIYASPEGDNRQFAIATSTQIGMVVLMDVKAINFRQFLSTTNPNTVVFKRSELTQAITLTKPLIEGPLKGADLVISADNMSLVSPLTDIDIEITSSDFTEEMTVHMNLDYLTPLLTAGKSEFVAFNIQNPQKPVLIQEMIDENNINHDYFSLVMPVRKA